MKGILAAVLCLASALAVAPAAAEYDFSGKTISVVVTSTPGGGTDLQGRLLGRFLQRHLPGQPSMIFVNVGGAGGIIGGNHFVQRTKPDGLAFLAASAEGLDPATLRNPTTRYDPRTLHFIGGTSTGGTILAVRKAALPRLTDRSQPAVVVGSVSTRASIAMAVWGMEYLGWNLRWVLGYASTPQLTLAMQRGEIDMTGTASQQQLRAMFEDGSFTGLAQAGSYRGGRLAPREDFPEIPAFPGMMEGKLSGVPLEAFEAFMHGTGIGKWYALAPGTDPQIVETYRAAFRRMVVDPEFVTAVKAEVGEDFFPLSAEDLTQTARRLVETSEAALKFDAQLRAKHGLPNPAN